MGVWRHKRPVEKSMSQRHMDVMDEESIIGRTRAIVVMAQVQFPPDSVTERLDEQSLGAMELSGP
jgi:hypothetical protein